MTIHIEKVDSGFILTNDSQTRVCERDYSLLEHIQIMFKGEDKEERVPPFSPDENSPF